MSWLVVTPARNEAAHLPELARTLAAQETQPVGLWVVVDDGSTDGTATSVDWAALPFPVRVLTRDGSTSGLTHGGAFAAFYAGADLGLELLPDAERVLKLDADVRLAPDYFTELARVPLGVALIGGVIDQAGEREHRHHVRGPLKAYNRDAFAIVRGLPAAVGHDVMDEVALRAAGLEVRSVPTAKATVARTTTSSEGLLRGRVRNGKVTRWTGYHPLYVVLRLVRYALRRPVVVGAGAMAWGYVTAGASPFPTALRVAHRREQAVRLRQLLRHPVGYLRHSFGFSAS